MFEPSHILDYVLSVTRETPVQRKLRERTAPMPEAEMQISPDEAAFLWFMVRAIGARKAIEVGTFTGYSALAIASALPLDGKLVCCDVSREWTDVGKPFWREAKVDGRIDLRIGPAIESMRGLVESEPGTFDFAFIDAEKKEYDTYYELALELLRPGGVIAFDNMLRSGGVTEARPADPRNAALRTLNAKIHKDKRVDSAMLTIRDGVMLVRKR
jgi:predicted O-methyltransferase YrrM